MGQAEILDQLKKVYESGDTGFKSALEIAKLCNIPIHENKTPTVVYRCAYKLHAWGNIEKNGFLPVGKVKFRYMPKKNALTLKENIKGVY